ncbi:hypothetical protein ACLB1S_02225 [Escherichia coli]
MMPALQLFGAGREEAHLCRCRRLPRGKSGFDDHQFHRSAVRWPCAVRSTRGSVDEVVLGSAGNRMFVCSN